MLPVPANKSIKDLELNSGISDDTMLTIVSDNVFFDIISGENGILTTREFGTNNINCKNYA